MACTFSLMVAAFIVICPGVRYLLYARPFHVVVLVSPVLGGIYIIFYETVRRCVSPAVLTSVNTQIDYNISL